MAGKIHIGTSGWSYKNWKGDFYPEELKAKEWLHFYGRHFDTTEINTSFYHLPKPQTVENWAAAVPASFRFCPKISRYLTHVKRLLDPEEPLQRFFDIFDPIKKHLGPVLVQLPPSLKFEQERIQHFFEVITTTYSDYDFALEVRHKSWMEQEALDMIKQYKIGLVISQSGVGFPYSEMITSRNIYIRFHGPGKLYASSYDNEMLKDFAKKFRKWSKEGHSIWAFFNNDWYAYATQNAMRLRELCKVK